MASKEMIQSINPATEQVLQSYEPHSEGQVEKALATASRVFRSWPTTSLSERSTLLKRAADRLLSQKQELAAIMTAEMGKPIVEAEAEIDKCARGCDYYAAHAEQFLAVQPRRSNATESYIQFNPLGTVLAIMPWNFPFWQVVRFAAPALMAGNTAILKHASNVPGCALAIQKIFESSGFPDGVFQTLLISGEQATRMIGDNRIAAVTLTGSEGAGREVAAVAGRHLKKTVLELGGSDPYIVFADADLEKAVKTAVRARFQNTGQSCIAAKRFIVSESIFEEFENRFTEEVQALQVGDPMDRSTQIGPMARDDLRDDLKKQVENSVQQGCRLLTGGQRRKGRGFFFEPTVLTDVKPSMTAAREEVFGPVAALLRVKTPEEAIDVANDSDFGLGANLWTADIERARRISTQIEAGQVFINGMVASDPRLPFGGVKNSGYGRELSEIGMREFVNTQTVWIGPSIE